MTPVIFHRLAVREVRRAVQWYSERSEIAPLRFRAEIDKAVERIRSQTSSLPRLGPVFQWVRGHRFPYTLVFRPRAARGYLVVAVAHTSRHPGYWRSRKE